jgi:hypothetical protein
MKTVIRLLPLLLTTRQKGVTYVLGGDLKSRLTLPALPRLMVVGLAT